LNRTPAAPLGRRSTRPGRPIPIGASIGGRFRQSPFIPFYEDRIGPDAVFAAYSWHLSPAYLGEDVAAEYWHLRRKATLFDVVEHPVDFVGPDAARFLDHLMTRNISAMKVGRCGYGLICYQDGGILMDGVLIRLGETHFRYVLADGEIFSWLRAHQPGFDVEIRDTADWVLQVQGPNALKILDAVCDGGAPDPFGYFAAVHVVMGGQKFLISRTGWTGELGFEIYVPEESDHAALWNHLLTRGEPYGLRFCSMAPMDIRRVEAGILDNGVDMDPSMTPFAAGIGAFVDFSKSDFIGRAALEKADRRPRLLGLRAAGGALEAGMTLSIDGRPVGRISAGSWSPFLECGIGYGRFDRTDDWVGRRVMCGGGSAILEADVIALPFYDAEKRIPRGLDTPIP
jgi:glycine cleavage system aminomethyltransferase T